MQNRLQRTAFSGDATTSGNIAKLISIARPYFEGKLELNGSQKILIKPVNNGCGINSKVLNTLVINRKPMFTEESAWTVDITKKGIVRDKLLGGVVDGKPIVANMFYHLYYFLTSTLQPSGYGLVCQPKVQATALSDPTVNGEDFSFTVQSPHGWAFGVGGKVSVYVSDAEWNTGTVRSVLGDTITITMDNESYSDVITATTTPWITQYGTDYFLPVDLLASNDNGEQTLVSDYYLLISHDKIYINESGSPVEKFIQFAYDPNLGFNVPGDWHKNMTDPAQILHPDYKELDGTIITNPLSPFVGLAVADEITAGRFRRASSTSGTLQNGTRHPWTQMNAAANNLYWADALIQPSNYDSVGGASANMEYVTATGQSGTASNEYYISRPVNISYVPIIKIVE